METKPRFPAKLIYSSSKRYNIPNAIAFDLDETIGSFSDFHSLWERLEDEMQTQDVFNDIMDLFPEFLRVGIFPILSFIRTKQESGQCLPIYIYTNNQCENVKWIERLIHYLELRVGCTKYDNLFAKPICAFKIRDKFIEPGRTTHEKTYNDFIRCSMINPFKLCFMDDTYYEKMKHRKVYYIKPPPYFHRLTNKQVLDRFLMSNMYKRLYPDNPIHYTSNYSAEINLVKEYCVLPTKLQGSFDCLRGESSNTVLCESGGIRKSNCYKENYEKERSITNKIMYYIREFFFIYSKRNKTKKRKPLGRGKFSRKLHHIS
jgi:hypothetical protein